MEDITELLLNVFFPHLQERQKAAKANNTRFVHYTTADSAMNVLRTKSFWMRDATCMNDFREIRHGLECLISAWGGKEPTNFKTSLNSVFPEITNNIEDNFDRIIDNMQWDTYISCFSEHLDHEDNLGRLSMWRAYGNVAPVAIVMNNEAFFNEDENFYGLFASPVEYCKSENIAERLEAISQSIYENSEKLAVIDREIIIGIIFQMLKFIIVCTKHVGFEEEKEWRAIHFPLLEPNVHIQSDVKTINGIPQQVYEIPLLSEPKKGVVGIEIPKLIDRIIIGPTKYPVTIQKAFVELLSEAGVEKPHERIFISDIPLRT